MASLILLGSKPPFQSTSQYKVDNKTIVSFIFKSSGENREILKIEKTTAGE
jgi:hypothetical protein